MNTELQAQEKTLPAIQLPEETPFPVKTKSDLAEGEKYLKACVSSRKSFEANFKPIKQEVDDYKKKLLSYEKEQISFAEKREAEQEKFNSVYRQEVATLQREVQKLDSECRNFLSAKKAEAQTLLLRIEKWNAQVDLTLAEQSKAPLSEKIDVIEEKRAEVAKAEEIQNTFVPEVVQEPVKLFSKKDEIKTKIDYFVRDEKAFIEWALVNNRSLLNITLKQAEVNKWIKENKDNSLVGSKEVF